MILQFGKLPGIHPRDATRALEPLFLAGLNDASWVDPPVGAKTGKFATLDPRPLLMLARFLLSKGYSGKGDGLD